MNFIKNSRWGKYVASVFHKYGKISCFLTAVAAFAALFIAKNFEVMDLMTANGGSVITIIFGALCAVAFLYGLLCKLPNKAINGFDFVLTVGDLMVLPVLVQLIVDSTSVNIGLFIVALVLLVVANLFRMVNTEIIPKKPVGVVGQPNANLKSYFKAIVTRKNYFALAAYAAVAFAVVFFIDRNNWAIPEGLGFVALIAVIVLAIAVLFSIAPRMRNKQIGEVDSLVLVIDAVLFLTLFLVIFNFTLAKLILWFVVTVLFALFTVYMIINTVIDEEPAKEEIAAGEEKIGFKNYVGQICKKYNVIALACLALLGFMAISLFAFSGFLPAIQNEMAFIVTALVLAVILLAGFSAIALQLTSPRVSAVDALLAVMAAICVLYIIPVIACFSVSRLIVWLVIAAVLVFFLIFRNKAVKVISEGNEVYSFGEIFTKEKFAPLWKNVIAAFKPVKDDHYISAKEQRKITKENFRITKEYEKEKKRKNVPESEYVTQMKDNNNIVEFENLHTYFYTEAGVVKAVNGVTFSIPQGSTVGVIGESGCGKSVTSLSLMQLVQAPAGQVIRGSEIRFKSTAYKEDEEGNHIPLYQEKLDEEGNVVLDADGNVEYEYAPKMKKGKPVLDLNGKPIMEKVQKRDENGIPLFEMEEKVYNVAKMPTEVMRKIRGREITMIFQEPMTSLNPIFTIGDQLDEVVLLHTPGADKESAKSRTFEMLKLVGIIPENVYTRYPHELSGGMRQRVMIAMALACHPKLIIADEPTTALDVTIQAQILDLLRDIKQKINGSIMFITHDLGVIAEMADFVVVMYAGRIIEMGTAKDIFDNPMHPYTMGLQKSKPAVNKKVDRLYSIPGNVPNPINMPDYCYFRDRCDHRCEQCNGMYPEMISISETHKVSCHLYDLDKKEEN